MKKTHALVHESTDYLVALREVSISTTRPCITSLTEGLVTVREALKESVRQRSDRTSLQACDGTIEVCLRGKDIFSHEGNFNSKVQVYLRNPEKEILPRLTDASRPQTSENASVSRM